MGILMFEAQLYDLEFETKNEFKSVQCRIYSYQFQDCLGLISIDNDYDINTCIQMILANATITKKYGMRPPSEDEEDNVNNIVNTHQTINGSTRGDTQLDDSIWSQPRSKVRYQWSRLDTETKAPILGRNQAIITNL